MRKLLFTAVALCAVAAGGATDEAVRAVDHTKPDAKAEPVFSWIGLARARKKGNAFVPPEGVDPHLYARVSFGKKHPIPDVLSFTCESRGDFFPFPFTFVIDGKSLVKFDEFRAKPREAVAFINPGDTTPWVDISSALNYSVRNIFVAKARYFSSLSEKEKKKIPEGAVSDFRIEFSRDGKTPFAEMSNGGGRFATALVSLARGTVESEVAMSMADLELALAAGRKPPARPKRFRVGMSCVLDESRMTPEAFTNEVKVMRLLGVNDTRWKTVNDILDPRRTHEPDLLTRASGFAHLASAGNTFGCICSPDVSKITNKLMHVRELYGDSLARGKKVVLNVMDEPGYSLSLLTNCHSKVMTCRERFGKDFCIDGSDTKLFLETVAYRDKIVCDFWKAIADAARAVHPNILITANVGISLVFSGNAGADGTSPFTLADSGAITIGQTEDWCNVQRTRQFSSYMCDVWRAATERNGLDFLMCSIILSGPETEAKAFAEVGHGVKGLMFFCYGPHWLNDDNRNRDPAMYSAVRHFSESVATAEDAIVGAKVAKGDAALFFSESGDKLEILPGMKRDWCERNPHGKDRMSASLMLTHCGVRTDVLDEKAVVGGALDGYKVLFATDRCLRRSAIRAIAGWMKRGGILVKTKEALTGDQFGEPLPENAFERFGKVVTLDFSPWKNYVGALSHGRNGGRILDDCYSHRAFDMDVLAKMQAAVKEAGIVRSVWTDEPLVEASLLEKKGVSVVALSNWTAEENKKVKVTVKGVRPNRVRSARGFKPTWHCVDGGVEITTTSGWGDFLVLE